MLLQPTQETTKTTTSRITIFRGIGLYHQRGITRNHLINAQKQIKTILNGLTIISSRAV